MIILFQRLQSTIPPFKSPPGRPTARAHKDISPSTVCSSDVFPIKSNELVRKHQEILSQAQMQNSTTNETHQQNTRKIIILRQPQGAHIITRQQHQKAQSILDPSHSSKIGTCSNQPTRHTFVEQGKQETVQEKIPLLIRRLQSTPATTCKPTSITDTPVMPRIVDFSSSRRTLPFAAYVTKSAKGSDVRAEIDLTNDGMDNDDNQCSQQLLQVSHTSSLYALITKY